MKTRKWVLLVCASIIFNFQFSIFNSVEAQERYQKKLAITTQMFLDEMEGRLEPSSPRPYAAPDTIDGQLYIDAFIRLNDMGYVDSLRALGVDVRSQFKSGLLTAGIPVDRLREVAALPGVSRVKVSPLMRPSTDAARQKTNVDDVLTLSAHAASLGLTQQYDGTGVLLGIIDCGIDFQHIAFKKSDGTSRISRAYVYDGSSTRIYTSVTADGPTTDNNAQDHGTHTASTAGGSSVIVSGSDVTVTDDHILATFGGMAPGVSLYLAGLKSLKSTKIVEATNKIVEYADSVGMPLVVSNSWGSQNGPHDGTGEIAELYNSLFGDAHPNHIALFASSNDAGKSKSDEGGGYHVASPASSTSPLGTIVRANYGSTFDGGYYYKGTLASAYARSTSVDNLAVKVYVLNANTGEVLTSTTCTSTGTVSGLGDYYTGTLKVYFNEYDEFDKAEMSLYTSSLQTLSSTGDNYDRSNYTLAIEVYPTDGSTTTIDLWGGSQGYFSNHLTTAGHTWTAGSDDMCVSDESTIANIIPVGAYVSKTDYVASDGNAYTWASYHTLDDIAYFSSYATAEASPTGLSYPWITAPGSQLVSGVNHYHTTDGSYYDNEHQSNLVVNSSTYPYGAMQGTSMATPTAAGIVALWLQAAHEAGRNLTVNDVKQIMRVTAISDSYTSGANASHFGNGKIDALAGLTYFWDGAGTEASPYLISNTTQFDMLAKRVNIGEEDFNGKYFRLTDDITYDGLENNYTPIGYGTSDGTALQAFNGHFDGQGHTVSGINIHLTGEEDTRTCQGVFGVLGSNGTVCNLTVSNSMFEGISCVGSLAGSNHGTIQGCLVKNVQVDNSNSYYGTITGKNDGTLHHNYYYSCTVGPVNATGVGCNAADVTANDGAVPVPSVTIEADGWHAIAAPMHGTGATSLALTDIPGLTEDSYDLLRYNEAASLWENQKNHTADFTAFEPGRGYIYRSSTASTLPFVGFANTGNITYTGVGDIDASGNLTTDNVEANLQGFHLLGNPYPHPITKGVHFPSTGLATGYYTLTTDGSWYARLDSEPIAAGNAFLVRAGSAVTLGFTESSSKKASHECPAVLAFTVSGNGHEDVAYALTDHSNSDDFLSLPKMSHLNAEAPALSISIDSRDYAIALLNGDTEEFPLVLNGKDVEYTLKASVQGTFPYLHLIDRVSGADIDLLRTPTYSFTHTTSQASEGRFLVKLSPDAGEDLVRITVENGCIVVDGADGEPTSIYDIMGRPVDGRMLAAGVYMVKVGDHPVRRLVVVR